MDIRMERESVLFACDGIYVSRPGLTSSSFFWIKRIASVTPRWPLTSLTSIGVTGAREAQQEPNGRLPPPTPVKGEEEGEARKKRTETRLLPLKLSIKKSFEHS